MVADDFDCFLSHNSEDQPAVIALVATLADLGIRAWLDFQQLPPGTRWQDGLEQGIQASRSVAVLVGPHGAGPWQEEETQAALNLAARGRLPVFAVLLPGVSDSPKLSVFLSNRTWVDLRRGLDDPSGLQRLVWGITGARPGLEAPGRDGPAPLNPFLGDSPAFIDRDQEVRRILEKLRAGNHCSLVGPPGSGKTALLQAIRPRLPGEVGIRADQVVWINFRTVSGLRGLQSAIVCELGGESPADWRGLVAARSLRLLILDDLGGMDPGAEGLKQRRWLRGLDDQFRTKLLMVSNERLDVLFRRDDPLRDSPLMGLDPVPVELVPLGAGDCGRLVELRLAGIGHRSTDYADLCSEPRQPRDLLGRCAERFHRLRQSVTGGLKDLQGNLDACPQPERVVVEKVVNQWLDLAFGVATDVGTLEAREPVASPYIVGAPVPADRLVGRESVYDQLRSAWVKQGQRDSLVVYGHRRMGKTSVMKNLLDFCPMGEDTGLAFLNLQTVDWSEQLPDLCQAIAFELWRAAGSDRPEPQPDAFASNPLAALRTFLAGLNAAPPPRRFILVLDEYELLDERLPPEAGTRFVELLRGLTQQYPWLVIALVGLHSLKERSASFYQAIFAWRPVRIGFLDVGGVADCLEVQDDAFPLAYDLETVAAVHRLTGGQPFLVQLLGDGLVQGFNRRLREEIRPPASRFTAADVTALTETGDLFTQGAAYFLGIWGQAGVGAPGQQGVLRALAPSADGLDAAGLARASGLGEADLAAALRALVDHDVLAHRGGRWGFTVELMRRWVAAGQMDLEPGAPA